MKKLLIIVSTLCLLAATAGADVLWDQSTPDPAWGGINDSQSGCAPLGNTTFLATDVSFGEMANINSISSWYNTDDPEFATYATTAYLSIWLKSGPTPVEGVDDPLMGTVVPITVTLVDGYNVVNAAGLDIDLVPGEYWVNFTPIALVPAGFTSQHMVTSPVVGNGFAIRPVCAQFGVPAWYTAADLAGVDLDVTLLIEGSFNPVAEDIQSWGQTKALFR